MRIAGPFLFAVLIAGSAVAQTARQSPQPPQPSQAAQPAGRDAPASPEDDRVRSRMRSGTTRPAGTTVNESQAADVTLTLSAVTSRPVQTWIRTAGTIGKDRKTLTASLSGADAALIKVGQRIRAFPPSSKSSMYQAFVTRVAARSDDATIEASLASVGRQDSPMYVMEIVVERGPFLSVPNEAIIEEGDRRLVYVQHGSEYTPQEIRTGIQGELYTQVLEGVVEGDQVVTFGSFFIDAEHKLKATEQRPQ